MSLEFFGESFSFKNEIQSRRDYLFADFVAQYNIKPNKILFKLSATNLFNTEYFKDYSITDIVFSSREFLLQPRFIMAYFEYRF